MRKILIYALVMCCFLFVACGNSGLDTTNDAVDASENIAESITHPVKAKILEINSEYQTLLVEGTESNSLIGDRCDISCSEAKIFKLEGDEILELSFSDLKVGDSIVADISEVMESYPTQASTTQIQLITSPNN